MFKLKIFCQMDVKVVFEEQFESVLKFPGDFEDLRNCLLAENFVLCITLETNNTVKRKLLL